MTNTHQGEIFVGDLEEHVISSISDVEKLIATGDGNRHIGETNMNEKSSRSHTIFRMVATGSFKLTNRLLKAGLLVIWIQQGPLRFHCWYFI